MIELKDASTLVNGVMTGLAADHATLASGLDYVGVRPETGRITVRLGQNHNSDLYLFLDLAGAQALVAALNDKIEWLQDVP